MGNVLTMVKGVKEKAYKALQKQSSTPNTVFWVDHFSEDGASAFVRHTIQVDRDGGFSVHRFRIVVGDMNFAIDAMKIGGTVYHEFQAKSMLEQQVTLIELDNWLYLDECNCPIYNVLNGIDEHISKIRNLTAISPLEVCDFFGEGYVKIQKVASGMRCFVFMDPFGEVFIKTSNINLLTWQQASSAIKNKFKDLCNVQGCRGFALEVVIDGPAVSITDVIFFHDSWCLNEDKEVRQVRFADYLESHNMTHIQKCLIPMQRVGVHALSVVLSNEINGALAFSGNSRFIITKKTDNVYFGSGHKGKYIAQYDTSLERIGEYNNPYIPDLSYLTFKSAVAGKGMFLY